MECNIFPLENLCVYIIYQTNVFYIFNLVVFKCILYIFNSLFCCCVLCNNYKSINVNFVYIDFYVFLFNVI